MLRGYRSTPLSVSILNHSGRFQSAGTRPHARAGENCRRWLEIHDTSSAENALPFAVE